MTLNMFTQRKVVNEASFVAFLASIVMEKFPSNTFIKGIQGLITELIFLKVLVFWTIFPSRLTPAGYLNRQANRFLPTEQAPFLPDQNFHNG